MQHVRWAVATWPGERAAGLSGGEIQINNLDADFEVGEEIEAVRKILTDAFRKIVDAPDLRVMFDYEVERINRMEEEEG